MEEQTKKLSTAAKYVLATMVVAGLLITPLNIAFAQPVSIQQKIDAKKSVSTLIRGSQLLKSSSVVVDSSIDVFRLTVDGEHILFFETEQEANDTMLELKTSFLNEGTHIQSINFVEDVEISAESVSIYEFDKFTDQEEALEYIKTGSLEKEIYVIEQGDTLNDIARDRDMRLDDVLVANPTLEEDTLLNIGQEINLLVPMPIISVKIVEVQAEGRSVDYKIVEEKSGKLYIDDKKVVVEGENGQSEVESIVTYINGRETSRKVLTENVISEPVDQVVLVGTKERPVGVATSSFQRPMNSYVVSSPFGPRGGGFHNGIDLATSIGTSVYAADGGTVTYAGWRSSYGYLVIIDHGNGKETYYAHLNDVYVSAGQAISQGHNIAVSGNTGRSTGPHLHFEIRVNGSPVNPTQYVGL